MLAVEFSLQVRSARTMLEKNGCREPRITAQRAHERGLADMLGVHSAVQLVRVLKAVVRAEVVAAEQDSTHVWLLLAQL